jgi:6-phosphogluconolactonase (cycloisomerase 2 family)
MMSIRLASLVAVLALGSVVMATGASASPGAPAGSPNVGQLYVDDNTATANTVAGFDRHADGSLTALPGSPFAVGGAGTGHATASQGALQLSADGRYLLAVDAGSAQVSVLRIKPDGSLQPADLVSSGGGDPVSIAVNGPLVYVANADSGSPNYTGFTLNPGGHLRPIAGSTVSLPAGSQPGDVLFSGDGSRLVGVRVASSLIDSFTVGADGLLSAAPGSPFPAQAGKCGPFGSVFSPTNPGQLFVSNAHTCSPVGPAPSSVSVFDDAPNGALTAIGGSPFASPGDVASCWVEISHDGSHLFVVNTASSTVSSFAIAGDGTLTFQGSAALKDASSGPEDARLSPDGSTLWVVESGKDAIAGFAVTGGSLSELPSSPTSGPSGATPSGIVVT